MQEIKVEINNDVGCNFNEKKLKLVIIKTIQQSYLTNTLIKKINVSIGFVSAEQMQRTNQEYRNKNYPTDVLSFANYENKDNILKEIKKEIFLGEILICCEDIADYSKKNNISFDKELYKVASHGVLHLLGFLHGNKMFNIQNKIADEIS